MIRDIPPPDPFGIPPAPERRFRSIGPTSGFPPRRKPPLMPDFHNGISFGQLLQAVTVASSTAATIFAAGQFVQRLHDDLEAEQRAVIDNRQALTASDAQITAAIQRLMAQQAQAAQAQQGHK